MSKSKPKWKWRAVVSVFVVLVVFIFNRIYEAMRGPIEGAAAVGQLSDNAAEYALAREVATGNLIPSVVGWCALAVLLLVWGSYGLQYLHQRNTGVKIG